MITPILRSKDAIATWLIDTAGNVGISISDLALLRRIQSLIIPAFLSTEEAMVWGSHLNPEQRATLLDIHRSMSNAARAEADPKRMVNLATQSQLMREAAEAAASDWGKQTGSRLNSELRKFSRAGAFASTAFEI
jgi:hypothetical protein